ncbi:MAG: hypothetical protein Q4B26_07380 [Eubacteriales bacterium]|nr:hypothetical protein [Eubacteriales bacterium]
MSRPRVEVSVPNWQLVIHPGPEPEEVLENLRDVWVRSVMKEIDAMHLGLSEMRELRKCYGFDDK